MTVVVVSWLLILLAVFGVNYSRDAIGESRAVRLEVERHQLRAWARSGVELARVTLERTPLVECAALARPGPDNPLTVTQACGGGQFALGEVREYGGCGYWQRGLGDEGARLPVALADSITLALLPGMTPLGVEILLQAVETAGEHRLAPFELLHLDEPSLECARRFLSRYGDAVNINSAPPEVLCAIGLPESAVDKLLRWRAGNDHIRGTADDRCFDSLDSDCQALRDCALNSEEAAVVAVLHGARSLRVESRYFRMASCGWGEGLDGICEIRAVLAKPAEEPVQILEWTENWLN